MIEGESSRVLGILSEAATSTDRAARVPQSASQLRSLTATLEQHGHSEVAAQLDALSAEEVAYARLIRDRGGRRALVSSGGLSGGGGGGGGGGGVGVGAAAAAAASDDAAVGAHMRDLAALLRSDEGAVRLLPAVPAGSRLAELGALLGQVTVFAGRRLASSKARIADDAKLVANRSARISVGEAELVALEGTLRTAKAAHKRELAELEERSGRLRDELRVCTGASEEALKGVQAAFATRVALTQEAYGATEATQRELLMKLQADYRAACDAHAEAEVALRKKVVRARLERDTALKEYDGVVGALREKLAAVSAVAEEHAAVEDYAQYYARVDAELAKRAREAAEVAREQLHNVTLRDWIFAHRCRKFISPWIAKMRKDIAAAKKQAKAKK